MDTQPLRSVMLMVTAQCHNSCMFCLNRSNLPHAAEELSIEAWMSVVEDIKRHSTAEHLFFIEREPFDKPGFSDLVIAAGQLGFKLHLSVGGSDNLTLETAERCAPYIHHLVVSYHGLEELLGRRTFERQERLLAIVRQVFLPAGVGVTVSTTICRQHAQRLAPITERVAQLLGRERVAAGPGQSPGIVYRTPSLGLNQREASVTHNFVQPCPQGGMVEHRGKLAWNMEEDGQFFTEEERRLASTHRCSRDMARILEYSLLPNGRPCGLEVEGSQGAAGYNRMTIRWDGEVVPCASSYRFGYGNMLRQGVADLWEQGYGSFRLPQMVNAYTIKLAFGDQGACCYGQDAAYVTGADEDTIVRRCRERVGDWQTALIARNRPGGRDGG